LNWPCVTKEMVHFWLDIFLLVLRFLWLKLATVRLLQRCLFQWHAGWTDWANFCPLDDSLLWAVLLKLQKYLWRPHFRLLFHTMQMLCFNFDKNIVGIHLGPPWWHSFHGWTVDNPYQPALDI
jgi:hypothetical protein